MIIRRAETGDIPAILDIWNPLIRDTSVTFTTVEKTAQGLADDLAARGDAFFVAETARQILGFATYGGFRGGPGYAHTAEHSVILAGDARGRGVGRALMARLEDHAQAKGIHVLIAGVSGENEGAIAFHRAIGFTQGARLPEVGRKFDRWMDLVLLHKRL
ncbi:phosphinothricin acetyltransferase [Roseovarius tolerans]|uniref:Phosphinothricin acetyltransferase n=1 Tax=Roseovarius tolerans TaxID=74031 RepID=A0A1H8C114_9RHOB|nr:GNAT family N-acetyltransferase [Roseovarius tolerans]SEM87938.1 phosphinothricin acetyltransferase [Roseovarius tolerans]